MTIALKKLGFEQCLTDPCVFRRLEGKDVKIIVGVHVDDMVVASPERMLFVVAGKAF